MEGINVYSSENNNNLFEHASNHYSFDIVLKVSERCNLACPYCYYFYQEYDGNANAAIIKPAVVAALPDFIKRSVEKYKFDRVNIVLHGGEPLLLKKSRFDQLCTFLRESLEGTIDVTFATQTNGVLIDDEWIDLFAKHDIKVGISIDGTPELHNKLRPDHNGRGSYDDAVRGLKMIQQAVADGKIEKAGALCVVHSDVDADAYLDHLINGLNVHSPSLNYPRGAWDDLSTLEWDNEVEKYRKMVNYWLANFVFPKFHYVRGISDYMLAIMSDKGAYRNDLRSATRHFIATISSEGALMVDDNLLGIDEFFADKSLNIFENTLDDLFETEQWQKLTWAITQKPLECEGCPWYRSCRSGELFNRYSKVAGFSRKSAICKTLTMIHEEVASYLLRNNLLTLEELSERLEKSPVVDPNGILNYLKSDFSETTAPHKLTLDSHEIQLI